MMAQRNTLGLVERTAGANPRVSVYRLTQRGESLRPALEALYAFGEGMAREMAIATRVP